VSFGIAVKTLDSAGAAHLGGKQSFFKVGGQPVIVEGDAITPHGRFPHAAPTMAQGSSWLKLNGLPACRAGHLATCQHPSTGQAWFKIPD
jgi:uncharacterized Zn-binding protein involved in type VI secretion